MHRFVLCILMLMIMVPAAIQAQVSTFSKQYIDTLKMLDLYARQRWNGGQAS